MKAVTPARWPERRLLLLLREIGRSIRKLKFAMWPNLLLLKLNHRITHQKTHLPLKIYQRSFVPCRLFTTCLIPNKNSLTMRRKSPRSTVMGFHIRHLCRAIILCHLSHSTIACWNQGSCRGWNCGRSETCVLVHSQGLSHHHSTSINQVILSYLSSSPSPLLRQSGRNRKLERKAESQQRREAARENVPEPKRKKIRKSKRVDLPPLLRDILGSDIEFWLSL